MTWIILEGLDRTGKSTVAKFYTEQGYEIIHMSSPDKKYFKDDYFGPDYYESMMDLYARCNGLNIIFDRSPYGELVWPHIFDRKSLLTTDNIDELRDIEQSNKTQYIYMTDTDVAALWKRCEDNREPIDKRQLKTALSLYSKLADDYGFQRITLPEFLKKHKKTMEEYENKAVSVKETEKEPVVESKSIKDGKATVTVINNTPVKLIAENSAVPELVRLREANAIDDVLKKRILRKKGPLYDSLENEIRDFLNDKLCAIFGATTRSFSKDEVLILKTYCDRLKEKLGG